MSGEAQAVGVDGRALRAARGVAVGLVGMTLVALGVGMSVGAEPPPVVGEVVKPAASQCDEVLAQALEELAYWRAQATEKPVLTVSTQAPPSPGVGAAQLPVLPTVGGVPRLTVPTGTPGAAASAPAEVPTTPPAPVVYTGPRPRLDQAAAAVKEMKPAAAALIVAAWDDDFGARVLALLPARATGAIAAALSPERAAGLLSRLSQLSMKENAE